MKFLHDLGIKQMKTALKAITEEKSNGRIYTPDYIVNNILDLSGYYGKKIIKKHVMDNSCGDGAFLIEIVKRYCQECIKAKVSKKEMASQLSTYIHGIEMDAVEHKSCMDHVNAVVKEFGIDNIEWDIVCGDTLKIDRFNGKMDFVLGNPPYVRVHHLGDSFDEIKSFAFSQGGMTDLFIVFYEIGIRMLNKDGVLGYITPSSFYNSLAGNYMRRFLVENDLIEKIVNLRHYQAFEATTYTTIVVLKNHRDKDQMDYYQYDEKKRVPYLVDTLTADDYYIAGKFYFSSQDNLKKLQRIIYNFGKSDIQIKNGYATLCDGVFIGRFDFESKYIIPVIKSSKGVRQSIIYPYDEKAKLVDEALIKKDKKLYSYLTSNRDRLTKRSNEKDGSKYWYAFGRSQALLDTYKDKVTLNTLIRHKGDLKFVEAPAGVGVYGGLYIISKTVPFEQIEEALRSEEFVEYITLLGKYKSGGYYTFSSKDVKMYLDYKFAYNGGLLC